VVELFEGTPPHPTPPHHIIIPFFKLLDPTRGNYNIYFRLEKDFKKFQNFPIFLVAKTTQFLFFLIGILIFLKFNRKEKKRKNIASYLAT
jgi:hypothetical protein